MNSLVMHGSRYLPRFVFAFALVVGFVARADGLGAELSLGQLVDAYERVDTKCGETLELDGEDCRESSSLERRLMELGWCRVSGANGIVQSCSTYRNYSTTVSLDGLDFGFTDDFGGSAFVNKIGANLPKLDGSHSTEEIGELALLCASIPPALIVRLEANYPDFVIRDDKVNFVAFLEADGQTISAPAALKEDGEIGTFAVYGTEMVPAILGLLERSLSGSVESVLLSLSSYEPDALLRVRISFDYYMTARYADRIQGHIDDMRRKCG